jgi:hypothetical protein
LLQRRDGHAVTACLTRIWSGARLFCEIMRDSDDFQAGGFRSGTVKADTTEQSMPRRAVKALHPTIVETDGITVFSDTCLTTTRLGHEWGVVS